MTSSSGEGDDMADEDMPDSQWRALVTRRLRHGDERFEALEQRTGKIEAALSRNTSLTQRAVDVSERTDHKLDEMRAEVQPVTDALKTMEAGIRTIGRVGDTGAKVGKTLFVGVLLWGCVKLAFSGASWTEISAAFMRALGR